MNEFTESHFGIHWTYDQLEYRYRTGRVSQDEWEASCAVHPHSAHLYPVTDVNVALLVARIADAYESHHGRPIEQPDAAVENIRFARLLARVNAS